MAQGIEAAAENVRAIRSTSIVSEEGTTVNRLSMKKVLPENTPCYRCGVAAIHQLSASSRRADVTTVTRLGVLPKCATVRARSNRKGK